MPVTTGLAVLGGASILGSVASSVIGSKSADKAANAQTQAAAMGVAEQQRQFDAVQKLLKPFVDAGDDAVLEMQRLVGLRGAPAQAGAIQAVERSPQYKTLLREGENAIRQNASATGGLRGGNIQRSLSEYRPMLFSQLLDQQYSRLGGLSQLGQASAAGQAAAGMATGQGISNLYQQAGAAQAGGYLAQGQAQQNAIGNVLGLGSFIGERAGLFGSSAPMVDAQGYSAGSWLSNGAGPF